MARISFYSGLLGMICSACPLVAILLQPRIESKVPFYVVMVILVSGPVLDAFGIISGIYFISIDKGERKDSVDGIACGIFGLVMFFLVVPMAIGPLRI